MIARLLPLAGVACLAAILVWRPWLQKRRYGTWGVLLFTSSDGRQRIRDVALVILAALIATQAIGVAVTPERIATTNSIPVMVAGALLMFGGLALLAAAQLDLGASWRIGIDETARPGLVARGLYAVCRHPIYAALLVALLGFALLTPTVLSWLLFAGAYVGVRLQIAAEEAYLDRTYGEAFRDYARRVGRLLPGIGRLR